MAWDPIGDIGSAMGDGIKHVAGAAFDAAMQAIWDAATALLQGAFILADQFSLFSLSTTEGPLKAVWPLMLWLSGVVALGLFFWQMTVTNLRGGRGFFRLVTGPAQYGAAIAVTIGFIAAFLAAADGVTSAILSYGLQSQNFTDAMGHTTFGHAADNTIKGVVLGLCAFFGVLPSAIGFVVEMLFRQAAIYVLAACVPITAAGLLAGVTAKWFWTTLRWALAAIAMKPVLALTLVIGVAVVGGAQGVNGLLAGVGVLIIALVAPFALFRLFAFVDPGSDSGGAFRDFLSGHGFDSYGTNSGATAMAGGSGCGGGGAQEEANTGRFDKAAESGEGDSASGDAQSSSAESNDTGSSRPAESASSDDDEHGNGSESNESGGATGSGATPSAPSDDDNAGAAGGNGSPGSGSGHGATSNGGGEAGAGEAAVIT